MLLPIVEYLISGCSMAENLHKKIQPSLLNRSREIHNIPIPLFADLQKFSCYIIATQKIRKNLGSGALPGLMLNLGLLKII